MTDRYGNIVAHPPATYSRVITESAWMGFVKHRQTDEFKVKSMLSDAIFATCPTNTLC